MPLPKQAPDAIQEDVLDADPAEVVAPVERPKSRRELDMEAIEASQLKRLEEETGVKLTEEPVIEAAAQPTEADKQLEAQLADEVIADPQGKKVRVKVNGVEQDVDLSEVLRNYQKGSAADQRLEEATRLLNEAKERQQAAAAPVVPVAPASPPVISPDETDTELKEAFEQLYLGDSSAAVAAIKGIMARSKGGEQPTPQPGPSIDEIATQLQQRLADDTALETIKRDYPEVIANPDIELLTAIKVNQKVAAGAKRSVAMLESAEEVYKTLGKVKTGRPVESQSESMSEKLKRKANLDTLPVANVAAADADDLAPANPSSLINEMAAARLGQSLPVQRR